MRRYLCFLLVVLAGCGRVESEVSSDVLVGSEEGIEYAPLGPDGSTTLAVGTRLAVTADVNLREAPSVDARVSMVLPKDVTVAVVERTEPENGYYRVDYLGRTGWAYGAYLLVDTSAIALALTETQKDDILNRALMAMGYSIWWDHARFGCDLPYGSCSSTSHTGTAGTDSPGMVAKAWAVPPEAPGPCIDGHPYSSTYFATNSDYWFNIDRSSVDRADAFVLIGGGHIMLRLAGTSSSGSPHVFDCSSCTTGCAKLYRTISSSYKAIRRDANL